MLLKFTIWYNCSAIFICFQNGEWRWKGQFAWCILSIQRNILPTSYVNLRTDALTFLCLSSDIRVESLRITSRFAQPFLTAASIRTVVRCFVNLDQLDDLAVSPQCLIPISVTELNAWLCLTLFMKWIALCTWVLYVLLKRIVSFSQSVNQSPNISLNDQHLFANAVKSTNC